MKSFLKCIGIGWAVASVFSTLIVGSYYLPTPWDLVCVVFIVLTVFSVVAFFMGESA